MPDVTALKAEVETDKAAVATAQTALDEANAILTAAENKLAALNFVNAIEALEANPDQLAIVQEALAADGSKITITVAP